MRNKISASEKEAFLHDWAIIAVLTLAMISLGATDLSFGVFLKPIQEEFGWTRTAVSVAVSLAEGIGGLVGIMMGRLADRHRPRMLLATCAFLGGVGYLLMSQTSSLWQLYLYFGVMVGVCITGWIPVIAAVSRRFINNRVLSLGIVTSGLTIAQVFLPPVVAQLIVGYGWRLASVVVGILVWIGVIPALILLDRNHPHGRQPVLHDRRNRTEDKKTGVINQREYSAKEALKTVQLWMLLITSFVVAVGFYSVTIHIVAYATDLGITTTSAALVLTIMSVAIILGRLLVASVTPKFGSRLTLSFLMALQALALFLLMRATNLWMFFALGAVLGFGFGGTSPIRMSMIPEFFGVRSLGAIMGTTGVAWAVGGITGPIMAGYIFDVSRSYDMAFLTGGLLMIIGLGATQLLKVPDGSLADRGNK